MFEKSFMVYQKLLDPPKSPLIRRAVSFHKEKEFVNIMAEKS